MTDAPQESASRSRQQNKIQEKISELEARIAYLESILENASIQYNE